MACPGPIAIAAVFRGLVTAIVLLRLHQLTNTLANLTQNQPSLSADIAMLDAHIDARIERYVAGRKQARIDSQYEPYALAVDHTNPGAHRYGRDQAPFTLIEFADIECGYCRRYHDVLKTLVDASEGKLNWQWKHLPLGSHNPAAMVQAQATECVARQAGNRTFWVYLHTLFSETRGNGQGAGDLLNLAESIGIDPGPLAECVDNRSGQQVIIPGLQTPEALVAAIRRLAARA